MSIKRTLKSFTLNITRIIYYARNPAKKSGFRSGNRFFKVIDRSRFELETNCLKGNCSTVELAVHLNLIFF